MKRIFITLCAITISINFSQGQNKNYLSNRYSLERMGSVSSVSSPILPGLPFASPDVLGDPFLYSSLSTGTLLLYNNQVIKDALTKYDVLHDEFYFQTKQGMRVLPGNQVKSFIFLDSLTKRPTSYINAKEFKNETGTPFVGFFEIVYDGVFALLRKTEATIQQANYHVALNVGRMDHKVNKKTTLYYLKDNVCAVLPAPKKLTSVFGNSRPDIDRYIKINQLNLKDERHLKIVFEYFNQITDK